MIDLNERMEVLDLCMRYAGTGVEVKTNKEFFKGYRDVCQILSKMAFWLSEHPSAVMELRESAGDDGIFREFLETIERKEG